jgi:hypothetical protein
MENNEFLKELKQYQDLDYAEVYVDEAYRNTVYLKIENLFDEFKVLLPTLSKEDATKTLVQFVKTAENNIKARYLITCDFRLYAASESAKVADELYKKIDDLLTMDFANYVATDPTKITAAFDRMRAMIAQFMLTPRDIVVYTRKDASQYSEATLTVSPSTIVPFNPLDETDNRDWETQLKQYEASMQLPTKEAFNDFITKHRIVKEYIKNEPKSKSMYNRKGYEKTYNYIREVKQTKMIGLIAVIAAALIIAFILLF